MYSVETYNLETYTIPSVFDNLTTEVFIYSPHKKSNKYCLIIHGLYGLYEEYDLNSKDFFLRECLHEELHCNVIFYNSSRKFKFDNRLDYKQRIKAFVGKDFSHEVSDLDTVIQSLLKRSPEIRISLIGNSLGGTIMIPVISSDSYRKIIDNAIFCGSGCGSNGSNKPILSSHPGETYLLNCIKKYEGNLLLLQGELDIKVPLESGKKIYKCCGSRIKDHIMLKGMDHSFSKFLGEADIEAKKVYTAQIVNFLKRYW